MAQESKNYSIRVATTEDERAVTELLEASYPMLMQGYYAESELFAALSVLCKANRSLLISGTFYLAETASKLVIGCGGWTLEHPRNRDIKHGLAHMRHFATHPDWTGKRVGHSIYRVCEREARSVGVKRFESQSSLNAERFYTALGFKKVGAIDVCLGVGVSLPGLLMRRSI